MKGGEIVKRKAVITGTPYKITLSLLVCTFMSFFKEYFDEKYMDIKPKNMG
jgi:hypothetical protein